MKKFYMVFSENWKDQTQYNALPKAETEARRLAMIYPELPIYVLEALSVFKGTVDVKSDPLTVCVGGKK